MQKYSESAMRVFPGVPVVDRRGQLAREVSHTVGFADRRSLGDRRGSIRYAANFPVELEVISPGSQSPGKVKGRTENISAKGLLVNSAQCLPRGTFADLSIYLLPYTMPIRSRITVVWTSFSSREKTFLSGLCFADLPEHYSHASDKFSLMPNAEYKALEQQTMEVRAARLAEMRELLRIEEEVWPEGLRATEEMLYSRLTTFPEGFLCAVSDGKIQGFVVTEIVNYDIDKPPLSWEEVTDYGYIKGTHDPRGDTLYGVSLTVSRGARKAASMALLEATGKLIIKYKLKRGLFGSRIPRYYKYARRMSVEEYVRAKTSTGRPIDPELALYQSVGLKPIRIIPKYINDPASLDYGVLVVWENPFSNFTEVFPSWTNLISSSFRVMRGQK